MKIISWATRSDLLTQSLYLQTALSRVIENLATQRDFEQLAYGEDFINQIKDLKNSDPPTYMLLEKCSLEHLWPKAESSSWYRIFAPISTDLLELALKTFSSLSSKEIVETQKLAVLLALLQDITIDLAQETPEPN